MKNKKAFEFEAGKYYKITKYEYFYYYFAPSYKNDSTDRYIFGTEIQKILKNNEYSIETNMLHNIKDTENTLEITEQEYKAELQKAIEYFQTLI